MAEIDELTAERKKTHGDFTDHAKITQTLKDVLRSFDAHWEKLNDCQKESIEMIVHKIGRIMAGDPNFADHWDDIGGYAKIARDRPTPELPVGTFRRWTDSDFPPYSKLAQEALNRMHKDAIQKVSDIHTDGNTNINIDPVDGA